MRDLKKKHREYFGGIWSVVLRISNLNINPDAVTTEKGSPVPIA
jgi:hypothetical protein